MHGTPLGLFGGKLEGGRKHTHTERKIQRERERHTDTHIEHSMACKLRLKEEHRGPATFACPCRCLLGRGLKPNPRESGPRKGHLAQKTSVTFASNKPTFSEKNLGEQPGSPLLLEHKSLFFPPFFIFFWRERGKWPRRGERDQRGS